MIKGRIVKALSGFYYVEPAEGAQAETAEDGTLRCRARGKFRKERVTPLVGDLVEVRPTEPGEGIVWELLPRRNFFDRPAVANVELLVVVASLAVPATDPFLIDRVAALAALKDCPTAVCVNKTDLVSGAPLAELYRRSGFTVLCTSAETGEGVEELRELVSGKLTAFTGNSGVGKSSLLNAIDPRLSLEVDAVSEKLGRGKHTTRCVALHRLACGGAVIDTPGFSSFESGELSLALKEKLPECFVEFRPYIGRCRFVGCGHTGEKGCAVLAAVKAGEIPRSRFESYCRMREELKELRAWDAPRR